MSQGTPAKQQRIERHLIRQRGAGVRSIAASFGFSLPPSSSSQVPSSDTTLVQDEPPTKRRKTIVELPPTEPKRDDVPPTTTKTATVKKARKRLVIEEADDAPVKGDGDDSFVFGQRKKETKRAMEDVIAVFNAQQDGATRKVTTAKLPKADRSKRRTNAKATRPTPERAEQPPTGRPKRGAATAAAMKVADGFVEENAPVDKKRRDVSPRKAAKARKTNVVEQTGLLDDNIPDGTMNGHVGSTEASVDEKPKSRKRKAAAMAGERNEMQQRQEINHATEAYVDIPGPRVVAETKGKRRRTVKPPEPLFATHQVHIDPVASTPEVIQASEQTSKKRKAEEKVVGHDEGRTKRVKRQARLRNGVTNEEEDASASHVKTVAKKSARRTVAGSGHPEPETLDVLPEGANEPDAVRPEQKGKQAARPAKRSKPRSRKTASEQTGAECAPDETAGTAQPSLERKRETPPQHIPQRPKPSRRRPLVETDINVTIRSTSPEKPLPRSIPRGQNHNKDETSPKPTPDSPTKPHRPSPPAPARQVHTQREQTKTPHGWICQNRPAAESRDLAPNLIATDQCPIDHDEDAGNNSGDIAMTRIHMPAARITHRRRGSRSVSESLNHGAATVFPENAVSAAVAKALASNLGAKPIPTTGARGRGNVPRQKHVGIAKEKVRGTEVKGGAGGEGASAQNAQDDVDWLFDASNVSRAQTAVPPKEPKGSTAVSMGFKSRTKMVEIDLDDLISNIASFAQQQVRPAGAARAPMGRSSTKRKA